MKITLRDYQVAGVSAVREKFMTGKRAVLYVLPTGGGKTRVFTYIASSAGAKGKRVLILAHRQELVSQSSLSLAELDVSHGLITPENKLKPIMSAHIRKLQKSLVNQGAHVHVASVQTISRPGKLAQWASYFDLIIVDEAHHATAGQWFTFLDSAKQARILGVTATPHRTDGQGLGIDAGGIFEDIVIGPDPGYLMDQGYLVRAKVYAPPQLVDVSGLKRDKSGEFNGRALAELMAERKIYGDAVGHYNRICPGQPAIVFCSSVKNAEIAAEEFKRAGWRAASIDGSMDDEIRRNLIEALGDGRIQILTSCDIISEGTDIPVVTAAIMLRPTDSESLFMQQAGRVLRPVYASGYDLSTQEGRLEAIEVSKKPFAIILDHVGNCLRHGLIDEKREWSLDGRPKRGRESDTDEKSVRVVQCPKCFAAQEPKKPAQIGEQYGFSCIGELPTGEKCDHFFTVKPPEADEIEESDLVEITDTERDRKRAKERQEVGMARTLEQFQAIAVARGYKPAWVRQMVKMRKAQGLFIETIAPPLELEISEAGV
jgi:DNA repair protein RadD